MLRRELESRPIPWWVTPAMIMTGRDNVRIGKAFDATTGDLRSGTVDDAMHAIIRRDHPDDTVRQ